MAKNSLINKVDYIDFGLIGPQKSFPEDLWDQSRPCVRPCVRPDDNGKTNERIFMKFGI